MDKHGMAAASAADGVGTLISHNDTPDLLAGPGPRLMVVWVDGRPGGQFHVENFEPCPAPPPGDVPVSVVVCTRDRPRELARCLASFSNQTLRPDQIIVVDNASVSDETRQVSLNANVTYLREDRPGLDIARNTGARAATGEIVAYTDDDVVLHPRWLQRLIEAFDAPTIWGAT